MSQNLQYSIRSVSGLPYGLCHPASVSCRLKQLQRDIAHSNSLKREYVKQPLEVFLSIFIRRAVHPQGSNLYRITGSPTFPATCV